MLPRICFATTCTGRLAHLRETLTRNISDNRDYDNLVLVVLEYAPKDFELENYIRMEHWADLESGRLVYDSFPDGQGFHVAKAKNLAMRCAMLEGADILVTVDADNRTGSGFARFLGYEMGMDEPGCISCPDHLGIKQIPHGPLRPHRGYAGRLAIRTKDFIKMGGYDETFDTWRGEDVDLNQRCSGRISMVHPQQLPRCSAPRFRCALQGVSARQNLRASLRVQSHQNRTETVVNYGNWGCGRVYRNFDPTPCVRHQYRLAHLESAFTKPDYLAPPCFLDSGLGFVALENQPGSLADLLRDEQRRPIESLEQSYALCDNPIPMLYEKLDRAYLIRNLS